MTTDAAGEKVSEMRYTPWGEVRYTWKDPDLNTTPAYALTPGATPTATLEPTPTVLPQAIFARASFVYNRDFGPKVGHPSLLFGCAPRRLWTPASNLRAGQSSSSFE